MEKNPMPENGVEITVDFGTLGTKTITVSADDFIIEGNTATAKIPAEKVANAPPVGSEQD